MIIQICFSDTIFQSYANQCCKNVTIIILTSFNFKFFLFLIKQFHLEQVVQYCKTERYFNEGSNIDIACNKDKLSIKLSYGFIDISGF